MARYVGPKCKLARRAGSDLLLKSRGRSLETNNTGTDHGWGGHHFVVGGAVRGQRFYGAMPSLLADNNPDDTGNGQIIPTLAVDQYAATLAGWFGVSNSDIATILPNLGRYSAANLRFLG